MRTYLVVANQTIGGQEIDKEIQRRIDEGECEFHVLVPVTAVRDYVSALGGVSGSGAAFPIPTTPQSGPDSREMAWSQARDRMNYLIGKIRDMGAAATGQLGDPDPYAAIKDALEQQAFDEIILSTLPSGISRWLKMDLSSRLERTFEGPITTIVAGD